MKNILLTQEEIANLPGTEKTHFLNKQAKRTNKSLGDLTGLTGFGFHIIEVEPGYQTTEMHRHLYEDECLYVLEGTAEAHIENDSFAISSGDFLGYKAGGLAHSITNTGDSTLRCIVVGQRLDHDVAEYPKLKKRLFRQPGQPWNLVNMEDIDEINSAGKK